MDVYIASRLDNWLRVRELQRRVCQQGHNITHDWTSLVITDPNSTDELEKAAILEYNGVLEADHLLLVLPGGRGTHVELGIMLQACAPFGVRPSGDLPITILADQDDTTAPTSFHHLKCVKRFTDQEAALQHVFDSLEARNAS